MAIYTRNFKILIALAVCTILSVIPVGIVMFNFLYVRIYSNLAVFGISLATMVPFCLLIFSCQKQD